jgi:hypothetical protein
VSSRAVVSILAVMTCIVAAIWVAMKPRADTSPRDLSALERAAATGHVQNFTDTGSLSVWASDFHRIEPELRAAAGDGEIRLMMGGTQVGTYSRRAGIQVGDSP